MLILKPGEFYFGSQGERLKTLLGSCIAITLWHPERNIGGMCHFLLPTSPHGVQPPYDGRYADHAMKMFEAELKKHRTLAQEYQVKLFGGANMFPQIKNGGGDIGHKNISAARHLLKGAGFKIADEHVGSTGHRTVILELETGHTWIKWQG